MLQIRWNAGSVVRDWNMATNIENIFQRSILIQLLLILIQLLVIIVRVLTLRKMLFGDD